ncbi:MAG: hypothetical protein SFU21_12965 [Flavihumibacter sp.]|nr:hypothetical protein [Flavihumibacter sp.]
MNVIQKLLHRPFFIKLLNWEYWSFNAVYGWILPVWGFLALRARSFFFFSASNPGIEYGGFIMESKMKIYDIMPPHTYPKTFLVTAGTDASTILNKITALGYSYPLIAKPDIGGRGRGVRKIATPEDVAEYAKHSSLNFLIQEYAPQSNEVGIFYYRYPGQAQGAISGIVRKEFLSVTGNGKDSIHQLILQDKRAILQLAALQQLYGNTLNTVLKNGEIKELVPYGNHARGAMFINDSHRITPQLTTTIDAICQQVNGFYFGRLDIRFNTWEELSRGENFSIIEINGAGSEPTHMYDPKHSLFFAWKEIIRHWVILWRISRINHKKGIPYLSFKEGRQLFKDNAAFEKKLETLTV